MICKNCTHLPHSHSDVGCSVPTKTAYDKGYPESQPCSCKAYEPSGKVTVASIRSFVDRWCFKFGMDQSFSFDPFQAELKDLIAACSAGPCEENYSQYRAVKGRHNGDVESWDSDELNVANPVWLCWCGWAIGRHRTWTQCESA